MISHTRFLKLMMMVTCKLWAQLANQLFMISATVAHALKMNTTYAIPRRTISPGLWKTYIHHLPTLRSGQATKHYFRQPDHGYTPIPEESDITLEGYFQSETYFNGHKKEIAEILGFRHEPAEYVSCHVRRGDYLKYSDRFPVLPIEYYMDAIAFSRDKGFRKFKIFSDDIIWCKKSFVQFPDMTLEFSTGKSAINDMYDMYNASAFIIANSSFSLYPALLRQDNPIVVAPAEWRWFGPNGQDMASKDRMPERFIKM